MKKVFLIIALFLCLSLSLNSETYDLGTIFIHDTAWHNVEVITKQEIRENNFQTVQEALEAIPGIYFSIGTKGETSIYIRGIDKSRIKVLIDGAPVNDSYYGTIDMDQFPIDNIAKIEVFRGLNASTFGGNAMGGVIKITTDSPKNTLTFLLQGDRSGGSKIYSSFSLKRKSFFLSGSLTDYYSPGFILPAAFQPTSNEGGLYRENSAFEKINYLIKSGFEFNDNNYICFSYNVISNYKELPAHTDAERSYTKFFRDPRYWRFPEWQQSTLSLNAQALINDKMKFKINASYNDIYNGLEMSLDPDFQNIGEYDIFDDTVFNLSTSLEGLYFLKYKIGVNFEQRTHMKEENAYFYDEYEISEIASEYSDLLIEFEKAFSLFILNFQLSGSSFACDLYDMNRFNYTFMAEASPLERLKVQLQMGNKINFPALHQLNNLENDTLEPEFSDQIDFSVSYSTSFADLTVAYFINRVEGLINRDGKGEPYYNINDSTFSGFEVSVGVKFWKLKLTSNIETMKAVNDSQEGTPGDYIEELPAVPAYKVFNKLSFGIDRLILSLEINTTGQVYEYDNDDERITNPGYTLVNLNSSYKLRNDLRAFLRFNNLLDTEYYNEIGFVQAGRGFIFGMEYTIN